MKKLKNLTLVRIKGLNQERAINSLCKVIKIFNLARLDKALSQFQVESKNISSVKQILASQGIEVQVLGHSGISSFWGKIKKNYGFLFAFALIFVVYFLQLGVIWQVNVYGTSYLSDSEISSFVRENFAMFKGSFSTKDVEKSIKKNFPRISSISVAVVGQSLLVNIYECVYPSEMEGGFSPIYADFDGKINKISLVQGTPLVKVGQIVRKGDILVQPYIIDSQGQQREVKPQAEILADVWLVGEVEHYDISFSTKRTGKVVENSSILLFGLEIYSNFQPNNFLQYEVEESESYLCPNNILPIKYKKVRYFQTITEFVEQPFEEVKEEKIELARQNCLILLQEYEIIKSEDVVINSCAGATHISYICTVERQIGGLYEDIF